MSTCPLTSSYDYAGGCDQFAGGVRAIYFLESYNRNTFTAVAGVVTVMTLQGSTAFRRYVPKKNTAFFTDSIVKSESGAISYKPTIVMELNSLTTTLRQEVQLLAKNYLIIVVLDNNGVYRLFGYDNKMDFTTADIQGGKLIGDGQKQTLTWAGEEIIPAYEITSPTILVTNLGIVAP